MKAALVCIAKDEDNYIKEWVNYHIKLRFSHVFIYENNWHCKLKHPNITKIVFNGTRVQSDAYNNFIRNYGSGYDWAAFFDVDEFLVLKKHKNVNHFLLDYQDYSAVAINWVFFGDNDHTNVVDENYKVLTRFTKRAKQASPTIKTIANLKRNPLMSVHHIFGRYVDTNHNDCGKPSAHHHLGTIDVAQLNHYFCKTKEEFASKILRGRASGTKLTWQFFNQHNHNDVDDFLARDFFYNT